MRENFVYRYGDSLYVNLTNKCSNACDFCIRNNGDGIGDSGCLWLSREPSTDDVINGIKSFNAFSELVFCGYGEPTYKMAELISVAKYAKENGIRTRLNTNGHGNVINGRDIVPELKSVIDVVSISLNADTAVSYDRICHSKFGEQAFDEMLTFAKKCVDADLDTVLSVVAVEGVDVDRCQAIAKEVGAPLRVREYIV